MAYSMETCSSNPEEDKDPTPMSDFRGMVGIGMTGLILRSMHHQDRVAKVANTYGPESFPNEPLQYVENLNDIKRETLKNEKAIYDRLGKHKGIVHCFEASDEKIVLAFAEQGDLKSFIEKNAEPEESFKVEWILSLIDALSYIHSRRVLVDEIALRNILVTEAELKFCDFGQSYLLPMATDMDTICENDLTAKIEILHLGCVLYSIAVWDVFKYYYFHPLDPQWPKLQEFPETEKLFCGSIIRKCWNGDYINVETLAEDARASLATKSADVVEKSKSDAWNEHYINTKTMAKDAHFLPGTESVGTVEKSQADSGKGDRVSTKALAENSHALLPTKSVGTVEVSEADSGNENCANTEAIPKGTHVLFGTGSVDSIEKTTVDSSLNVVEIS